MTDTQKRVLLVLDRIKQSVQDDDDNAFVYSNVLDDVLDEGLEHDFFGTEGQCDPRGDRRNGDWSMTRVEGIDD